MQKTHWLVFTLNGKELCSYTLEETFPGEKQDTIELLAYENGVQEKDIETHIEIRERNKG